MEMESTTGGAEAGNGHRSIGELTKAISRDATALVRAEVQLAKDEMAAKAKESAVGGGMLAVAALFGVAAFGTLVAMAVAALSTAMATWLAALIVAVVLLVIAAVVGAIAVRRLRRAQPPAPTETIESAKEDVQWLKQHATSERR
ncbi:MAG TPA: phage holin family protein [Gaiellales bacterium]|nr:phage holin family protein [Gaiellales bacterium]